MKHTEVFDHFLKEVVNLNQTRVDVAESAIVTMNTFLQNNDVFKDKFISATPQGSYRQGTIIKPVNPEQDFDVDLLFELSEQEDWEAADYLKYLAAEFKKTDRYKDKVDTRGKTRCVTIDYESDFHIDIVPSIQTEAGQLIMNKETNEYEETDGDGYAQWFNKQNSVTGKNYLVKVTRLAKYLRDYHQAFEAKSVLLTTLLGNQVLSSDDARVIYSDLPTAFKTILNRLDTYLQANETMPKICNPALPKEEFTRNWDEEDYKKFRAQIHKYNDLVDAAYEDLDEEKSLQKWKEIFGDEFAMSVDEEEKSLASLNFSLGSIAHQRPLMDICKGERITHKVHIDAYVYSHNGKTRFRGANSDTNIPSERAIKYIAKTNFRKPYDVQWQVVNTGDHATKEGGLRGEFFPAKLLSGKPSSNPLVNWESTLYTGRHWIECFIIDKEGYCVARSKPFFVNVKNPLY